MSRKTKDKSAAQESNAATPSSVQRGSLLLLGIALLAASGVYAVAITDRWFYDDADYVLNDPRLQSLKLFSPLHWHEPPPPLPKDADPDLYLPGYDKPLIADRYLWRLSFALERAVFGESYSATHAHTINLLIHLACVAMLFFSLRHLLLLYQERSDPKSAAQWQLWPGLAALIFAVHPWAAEPACYVSARNGSMGAFFALLALALWAIALKASTSVGRRALALAGFLICCVAAYGCKENFIVVPAALLVVTWPVLWARLATGSRTGVLAVTIGGLLLLMLIGYAGIRGSDRAAGLFAQTVEGHGKTYFVEIQSPILLMTLLDQLACARLSLETGHPGWPQALCWLALALNAGVVFFSVLAGKRWPALLGLSVFYLLLLPTNSILPRPDFLAARNVYLPCAAMAALFSGALLYAASYQRNAALFTGGVLLTYWMIGAYLWAGAFTNPVNVWARSSRVAPEHATVRLNHANSILRQTQNPDSQMRKDAEAEFKAALAAEDSPTMRYHSARPRANRRAVAYRALADLSRRDDRMSEAGEFIRQSWQESNNLQTWLTWADLCFTPALQRQTRTVVDEGFRVWPNAWWPRVVRGMFRGKDMKPNAMSHEVYSDLVLAEQAPDSPIPPLRGLQARVLGILARSKQARDRAPQILARLSDMGVPESELEAVQQDIQAGR